MAMVLSPPSDRRRRVTPPRKYPFLTSSTVMRFFFTLLGILGDTLAIIVIIAIIVRLFPSPVRSSH